jgi:suppressor of ftsI
MTQHCNPSRLAFRFCARPSSLLNWIVVPTLSLAFAIGSAAAAPFDLFGVVKDAASGAPAVPFATPFEYRSENGVLNVNLEAKRTRVSLGKTQIDGATYNGVYGGPVLRVRPGDQLHLRLINHLPQATNIHFHGLNVSPKGHGDNSMHMVAAGDTWDYEIAIPKNHPPGLYWFHTHAHDAAERQVMGGLSGTLIVEGFQDAIPATQPLKERLIALKEFSPDENGKLNRVPKPVHLVIKTVNGQLNPQIDIQPGESQLWRFSDQTANTYFRLMLEGHTFTVVGRDGQPLMQPEQQNELIIGPSQRTDVIVTAPVAGRFKLVAKRTATGPMGDMFAQQDMALLVAAPVPGTARPASDRIDAQRTMTFSEDPVTGLFFINHATFDPKRVDLKVPLGSIEEWTVRNSSEELHVFHLHQVHFQVVSVNGKSAPFTSLVDTINVPIHGEVKIRVAFTDPAIVGRFMFHCHILEHEDKGMMSQMEVYDPKTGPLPDDSMDMGNGAMSHGAQTTKASDQGGNSHAHTAGSY